MASPASYRPEFGKAGLSLRFLFLLAAVSWAKMPQYPLDADPTLSVVLPEINIPEAPAAETALSDSAVKEESKREDSPRDQTSSTLSTIPVSPAERVSPEITSPVELLEQVLHSGAVALNLLDSPLPTSSVLDTLPYVPVIPAMKQQPKLPALPNFPYTTEQLEQELSKNANDRNFLRNTIDQYQAGINQWHAQVKADYLSPWGDWRRTVKDAYQAWKTNLKQLSKGDDIAYAMAIKKGSEYLEKTLREEEDAINMGHPEFLARINK